MSLSSLKITESFAGFENKCSLTLMAIPFTGVLEVAPLSMNNLVGLMETLFCKMESFPLSVNSL